MDDSTDLYEYNLSGETPGLAVIICNSFEDDQGNERKGANKDAENMKKMFKDLNFKIKCFWNEDADDLIQELKTIAKSDECEKYQSLICVISSHGHEEEIDCSGQPLGSSLKRYAHMIKMKDKDIRTNEILAIFDDQQCAALKKKPKIFFIQACRNRSNGDIVSAMDDGVPICVQGGSVHNTRTEPCSSAAPVILPSTEQGNSEPMGRRLPPRDVTPMDDENPHSSADPTVMQPRRQVNNESLATGQSGRVLSPRSAVPPSCRNNFLVMYACVSGAVAWNECKEDGGAWMLCKLYEVITEKIKNKQNFSLTEVLTQVTSRMSHDCISRVAKDNNKLELDPLKSNKKCVPCYESKLTREVNFKMF